LNKSESNLNKKPKKAEKKARGLKFQGVLREIGRKLSGEK
jgi:hypothetical protein